MKDIFAKNGKRNIALLIAAIIFPSAASAHNDADSDSIIEVIESEHMIEAITTDGLPSATDSSVCGTGYSLWTESDVLLDSIVDIKNLGTGLPKFKRRIVSLYDLPYSRTLSSPDWPRLWENTALLVAGGVSALFILEALPDDATAWNRSERMNTPLFERWWDHVKRGPVWDHDKWVFNYLLHPYGGGAYYMGARSAGFNMYQSLLYCFCISTFFWEYGIEAFNEVPSVQDLFVTPIIGSAVGEGFYLLKRHIVAHDYRLLGTPILGNFVAFIIDPLNTITGLIFGDPTRRHKIISQGTPARQHAEVTSGFTMIPTVNGTAYGFSVKVRF